MKRRNLIYFIIYVAAIWHGYAIIARPLLSFGVATPFPGAVSAYSKSLRMYPAWSFFSAYLDTNISLEYRINGNPEVQSFYSRGNGYFDLARFYRCGTCANGAYQFYLKNYDASYPWLAGKFICALNPNAPAVTIIGKKAHYKSLKYEEFKSVEVECVH